MNYINKKTFENFTWVDICQPEKVKLKSIAKEYGLDIYQIKDSLETGHLPKFEQQTNYNFIILRAYSSNNVSNRISTINELSNKIAFFYNENQIITVHTKKFDFLLDIDYDFKSAEQLLLYIIHKMIDSFDKPSKFLAEQVDKMEQTIFLKDFEKVSLEELYFYKSQSRITKKLLQISQNVINHIEVKGENLTALQDIKDSLFSLSLTYDEVLDDAINLTNTYLSFNAQKSNDVMKLLTIFSAFFLPLTFIAGIYGMNFDNMPELKSKNGYYITMGSMLVISICIYAWFKKKKII
ncbi:MAG: hypothetical protein H6553_07920 [Chitinophagales bacterium]|nr:hypothetical protein [Chitinophagales bacterium]